MMTFLLLAAITLNPPEPPVVGPGFEVRIDIHPSYMDHYQLLKARRTPSTFTCTAEVFEVGTNRIYGSADLAVLPGHNEKTTQTFGDYTMTFSVKLNTYRAEADVTVKRGEQLITRQRSTVYVRANEGIVPLN